MELSELRIFASVAQTLNFSKTAEQFFISQPAVSHKIKQLEHDLGVLLIHRNRHQVSVTPEGMEFLEYVNQIIELADLAEVRMKNRGEGRSGRIKIAALPSSSRELTKCLSVFSEQYPNIQTDIDLLDGPDLIKAIEQNSHDIYFAVEKMLPAGGHFDFLTTKNFQLHLYMPKNWAHIYDPDNWKSIAHLPFVSVLRTDTSLFVQAKNVCYNRGIKQKIIHYNNRVDSILISVSAGIGIAILPESVSITATDMDIVSFPIAGEDAQVTSVIAWNSDNESMATSKFIDIAYPIYENIR